jgi:hypothetical protein
MQYRLDNHFAKAARRVPALQCRFGGIALEALPMQRS